MIFDYGNANENQKKAISITEGPVMIIAGPGTGKTYTVVKRIAYLIIEKKVSPENIMVVTFTEKAAKELMTRITNELLDNNISVNYNEMYIGTFHSICLRILDENLEYTRLRKNYRTLETFDQQYLIYDNIKSFETIEGYYDICKKNITDNPSRWSCAGTIGKYVSELTEEMIDFDEMKHDSDKKIVAVSNMLDTYNKMLDKENAIDFSGMQVETYKLLKNNPAILVDLQKKVQYIMVDEYQDTNHIQELLVLLIAGERKNICVVGDDDQGLYRFRGASIRNILEFSKNFVKNECKEIKLVENYRSDKQIIDFYNKWMSDEKSNGFSWGKCRLDKKIKAKKKKCRKGTSVIKCSGKGAIDNWYDNVYSFIKSIKKQGILSDYNQIAVLCNSVKYQDIIGLSNYLEERDIKTYSPRSNMFFKRQEIKQALGCIIPCFPEYSNGADILEKKFTPNGVLKYYEEECLQAAKEVWDDKQNGVKKWIEEKRNEIKNLEKDKKGTGYAYLGLLYQLFQFKPFRDYIGTDMKSGVVDERPARNLSKLTEIFGKYDYLKKLVEFNSWQIKFVITNFFNVFLRFMIEGGIEEYENDKEYAPSGCISFMTIHQSKGMEFPVVIVDSLFSKPQDREESIIDIIKDKYLNRGKFEEKNKIKYYDFWRLYYTAFSRAQNLLVLSCNERYNVPSENFKTYYDELLEYREADLHDVSLERVKNNNMKDTFSFTSNISVYENCALQYKFFNELQFTRERIGATIFGTLVHQTIEDIHRAAMRHEETSIVPENVKKWLDNNYSSLSLSEHAQLGRKQIESAYTQVMKYVDRAKQNWSIIQEAEVEVSLVKPEYILLGKVDLVRGDGDTVEIIDFKSSKRPDIKIQSKTIEQYRKQLEVYAYLIEQKTKKTVSKMHLYYTEEDKQSPIVSFDKSGNSIEKTIKEFDKVVNNIQKKDFSGRAKEKSSCNNCDMRYYCKKG